MRRSLIALLAVVLLAGCGGSGTKQPGAQGGAAVAPISTPLLVRVNTAFESQQWQAFTALLKLFPDGDKLFSAAGLKGADFNRDVRPALGRETDLLALGDGGLLAMTQPRSPAKLDALLARTSTPAVSEEIADWRVVARDRATIDRFKRARNQGILAGSDTYKEATAGLPAGALATFYANGDAFTTELDRRARTGTGPVPGLGRISWLSGALTAKAGGLAVDLRLRGDEIELTPFVAALPAQVPANVALYADFKGLDALLDELRRTPALRDRLGAAEQALGGLLDEVIGLFKGEGAFYARSGPAGPEYTLVLTVADEQAAAATLDRLATIASALGQTVPQSLEIAGVLVHRLVLGKTPFFDFGQTAIYYAVFDGLLVISNRDSGIRGLTVLGGPRLAGSQAWRDAGAAAGLPGETAGILYVDARRALPLLATLPTGKGIWPQVKRNLAPLRTALLYASVDRDVASVKGFVSVR